MDGDNKQKKKKEQRPFKGASGAKPLREKNRGAEVSGQSGRQQLPKRKPEPRANKKS